MELTDEQKARRERYLIALLEATHPLQQGAKDPEVNLELLIDAAGLLQEHLESELAELRTEQG